MVDRPMLVEQHEEGVGRIDRDDHHRQDDDARRQLLPRPFLEKEQGKAERQGEFDADADYDDEHGPHDRIDKALVVPEC